MNAEKIPIQKMEFKKGQIQSKLSLLENLISMVSNLKGTTLSNRTARSFRELKVADYNNDIVDISVDKNIANPGSYQFEVVSLAQKSSAFTNGVEDPKETYLGVGYLGYELPNGDEKEIYIDSEHSSLNGIAKLINGDTENGMSATVVDDGKDSDSPHRLIISLEQTGDKNKATFPYFYLVDGEVDLNIDQERQGRDAVVKLDGFEIEVSENQVNDLIKGVSIDLKKAQPGVEFTIEVTEDVQKVSEKVSGIIENVNNILSFIKKQNSLDESSDTKSTLGGDLTLQTLESRLRSTIFENVQTSSGLKRLGDIGITFQRSGLIKLDSAKFQSELKKDFKGSAEVLVGQLTKDGLIKGAIHRLSDLAETALSNPNGFLTTRKGGLRSKISQIDQSIANKERHIQNKERVLKEKFARLEETMSQIKAQGQGLAGLSGGQVNPIQNLG